VPLISRHIEEYKNMEMKKLFLIASIVLAVVLLIIGATLLFSKKRKHRIVKRIAGAFSIVAAICAVTLGVVGSRAASYNTTNVVIEEQAEVVPTSELYRGSITVGTELAVCSYKGKTVAVAAFTPATDGSKTVYFEVFSNDTVKVTIEGTSYTAPAELVALFR
jgi:nitrogen fixation/metabolism regulation signal transduction histidine kinase